MMTATDACTRVRLLISDVDGTLVRADKSLAEATVVAVRRLAEAGVPMTLVSARPPSGMFWLAERLDLDGPFGAFNGGTLFGRDGRVIERHCLDRDLVESVLALVGTTGITTWLFSDGEWLASNDTDSHTGREKQAAMVDPVVVADFLSLGDRLGRVDKIVGVSDDHALLVALEARVCTAAGARATIARSQPYYLDITAPVANKGDGVTFLARAFGVELAHVAVIGDQANDLPMFARAGLSIAMGQASDAVKARATAVTGSSEEDGVAQAIERIVLPRGGVAP
jgi:Cof subfamily protein (haloacid dehalogenase superfamily)